MEGTALGVYLQFKSDGQSAYIARRVDELMRNRPLRYRDPGDSSLFALDDHFSATTASHKSSSQTTSARSNLFAPKALSSYGRSDEPAGMALVNAFSPFKLYEPSHDPRDPRRQAKKNPFQLRIGRLFLRDVPYPLPCDLPEMHRQNLRTLLACRVFGRAVCSPWIERDPPRKVLEIGCGSGYWSSMCHNYFATHGHKDVAFTGLDIVPMAVDLNREGVDWKFVQHNFLNGPLPFKDGEFDFVMCKDVSMAVPVGTSAKTLIHECTRVLREKGTLEVWEADHVMRSLRPQAAPRHNRPPTFEQKVAQRTGTVIVRPTTQFGPAQSKVIQQSNCWIYKALGDRSLAAAPCARVKQDLYQEPTLVDLAARQIAIPLGEVPWRHDEAMQLEPTDGTTPPASIRSLDQETLAEQLSIRHTALTTVVQGLESMELIVREAADKNDEEWTAWWSQMTTELLDPNSSTLGEECLEIGAWWATKRTKV